MQSSQGIARGQNKRGKTRCGFYLVIAALVPAISIIGALCLPDRHRRGQARRGRRVGLKICSVGHVEIGLFHSSLVCNVHRRVSGGRDSLRIGTLANPSRGALLSPSKEAENSNETL